MKAKILYSEEGINYVLNQFEDFIRDIPSYESPSVQSEFHDEFEGPPVVFDDGFSEDDDGLYVVCNSRENENAMDEMRQFTDRKVICAINGTRWTIEPKHGFYTIDGKFSGKGEDLGEYLTPYKNDKLGDISEPIFASIELENGFMFYKDGTRCQFNDVVDDIIESLAINRSNIPV